MIGACLSLFRLLALLLLTSATTAYADIGSDEDELIYEMTLTPAFKAFHARHGRYPKSWTELRVQSGCSGYQRGNPRYYPKPGEAIVWRPDACTLSYKIQFADKRRFRVVALANGHVVSINDTFRVTYMQTPYHDHGPYECGGPPGSVC